MSTKVRIETENGMVCIILCAKVAATSAGVVLSFTNVDSMRACYSALDDAWCIYSVLGDDSVSIDRTAIHSATIIY